MHQSPCNSLHDSRKIFWCLCSWMDIWHLDEEVDHYPEQILDNQEQEGDSCNSAQHRWCCLCFVDTSLCLCALHKDTSAREIVILFKGFTNTFNKGIIEVKTMFVKAMNRSESIALDSPILVRS